MSKKNPIGRVVYAGWDQVGRCARLRIRFDASGLEIEATCNSGLDPTSGFFVSEKELCARCKAFEGMVVYDTTGGINPRSITRQDIGRLKIRISLGRGDVEVIGSAAGPDANYFLARILR